MQRLSDHFLSIDEWRHIECLAYPIPARIRPTRTMAMACLVVYTKQPFNVLRAYHVEELLAPWLRLPWQGWEWIGRLARIRREYMGVAAHHRGPFFARRLWRRWVILGQEGFEKHLALLAEELGVGPLSLYALEHVAQTDTVPAEPLPADIRRLLA